MHGCIFFGNWQAVTQFRLFAKERKKIGFGFVASHCEMFFLVVSSFSTLDLNHLFLHQVWNIYPHAGHCTTLLSLEEAAQSHDAVINAHFCTIFNSLSLYCFILEPFRVSDTGLRHVLESQCAVKLKELNLTNCVRIGDIVLVNINKRYW